MQLIKDLRKLREICLKDVYEELLYNDSLKILLKWGKYSFTMVKTEDDREIAEKVLSICISNIIELELDAYNKSVVLEFITPVLEFYRSENQDSATLASLFSEEHYNKLMS